MISTKEFEGLRLTAYTDTMGYKTIGYGHNLSMKNSNGWIIPNPEQRSLFTKLNIDFGEVYDHNKAITIQQANMLFDIDMDKAIRGVRTLVSDYDSHPPEVQAILNDLCFNLGKTGLSLFKTTLALFNKHDYKGAAASLTKSLWFRQTKTRAQHIVEELNSIG